MLKEEIQKKIFELTGIEDTTAFVRERLRFLEKEATDDTMGIGHTDSYKDFIGNKTHYKAGDRISDDIDCPDLIFDDLTPYINLIRVIRQGTWYDENVLLTAVFVAVDDYLPKDPDTDLQRVFIYYQNKDERLSIKKIKETRCSSSSEKAALAHNMFKFLGMDSEVVFGVRNSQNHSYNFVYPNGYEGVPVLLYDPSFHVRFQNDDNDFTLGYVAILTKEEHEILKSNKPLRPELDSTETMYRMLYGTTNILDDKVFNGEEATYSISINSEKDKVPR